MIRRWRSGMRFEVDGISYRTRRGHKGPDDLVLEHLVNGDWVPVRMRQGALLADFFHENEDILYPPPAMGGRYYIRYLHSAVRHGWDKADALLRVERRQKEFREDEIDEAS